MQGTGNYNAADERRVPFVCRMKVDGLAPNKTYRYYHGFTGEAGDISNEGTYIIVNQQGDFVRVEAPTMTQPGRYGELTTDANGSYTGWFAMEQSVTYYFEPGVDIFFRLNLNDGNNGTDVSYRLTSQHTVHVMAFNTNASGGTALRSTPATHGVAKNFVMLYDRDAAGARPVVGAYIESDGVDNSLANRYADFYANDVNGVDKAWGVILPNNLVNGIRKISQYSLVDGSEVGFKTSADGSWARQGGGLVSTVNTTGGLTDVIVLDGSLVTLGLPVQQSQTINFAALPASTYGDALIDPGATASSGLEVSYESTNPAVAVIENGKVKIVGAGTTDIRAGQAGNVDYSAATPVTHTLTVNKAVLTITADNKVKVQDDPLPAFTASYAGFVQGDDAGDLTDLPVLWTNATPASPAGTYPITATGASAANYSFVYVTGTLTVTSNKQTQTITFEAIPNKVYGVADFAPGANITSGLPIEYTSSDPAVATIVGGKIRIVGAGSTTITATHPGNVNYEPATDVSQSLTIEKAPLVLRAENKTKLAGQANPGLTITYTGFVYNESSTVFTTQPVINTTATTASPVGDYPITITGAVAANYTLTYIPGVLTVSPLPTQVITFGNLPVKKYGDAPFAPGATASSGLPVAYSSSNTAVAVIENGTVKIVGAGTATITASQPGGPLNAPAPDVTRALTVQKVNLVVRVEDTVRLEGQANPVFVLHYAGFVNDDDASKLTSPAMANTVATVGSIPGTYPLTVSGAASPNYHIAQVGGVLKVLPMQGSTQDYMTAYVSSPGKMQVNIHAVEAGKTVIQLFDQPGTRLLQVNVTIAKGFNTYQLPVANVSAGIYHVRVAGPGFVLKSKVVIR